LLCGQDVTGPALRSQRAFSMHVPTTVAVSSKGINLFYVGIQLRWTAPCLLLLWPLIPQSVDQRFPETTLATATSDGHRLEAPCASQTDFLYSFYLPEATTTRSHTSPEGAFPS